MFAVVEEEVILRCQTATSDTISILAWRNGNNELLFYIHNSGGVYDSYQHDKLKGRVELVDPSMTNGTGSLRIRKVGIADAGLYQCVFYTANDTSNYYFVQHIELEVIKAPDVPAPEPDPDPRFRAGVMACLGLSLFIIVAYCTVTLYRKITEPLTDIEVNEYKLL